MADSASPSAAIVTGAGGPVGLALVRQLLAEDVSVAAIVRPGSPNHRHLAAHARLEVLECDVAALATLRDRLRPGFHAFYHLGWSGTEGRATRSDPFVHAHNVLYCLEAVRVAHALGCHTFVGAGSQAEQHTLAGRGDHEESYGIGKLAAGRMSWQLCQQLGLRHGWGRIASIYGPGERMTTALMYCIGALLRGEVPALTAGEQQWDYLYAADCARALRLIGARGRSGVPYEVGSGTTRPLRWYFERIRDAIDRRLELGLGQRPYAPNQLMTLTADTTRLVADTGFAAETSFEQGIAETIAWVRQQMHQTKDESTC